MFVYKLKSSNSLISHISVSGQYLTFWQRKNYSAEITIFIEQNKEIFGEIIRWEEDPRHSFFHNDKKITQEHLHVVLKKELSIESFNSLITALKNADSPEAREKGYEKFIQELNEIRIKNNGKEFPDFVKKVIKNFNKSTPIIPLNECDELLRAFETYRQKTARNLLQNYKEQLQHILIEHLRKNRLDNAVYREAAKAYHDLIFLLQIAANLLFLAPYLIGRMEKAIDIINSDENFKKLNDSDLDCQYPVNKLSPCLSLLKADLHKMKILHQDSWYKKAFEFIPMILIMGAAFYFGVGLFRIPLMVLSCWLVSKASIKIRDWHKFNCYETLTQKNTLTNAEQESAAIGIAAANSTTAGFFSLFSPAAWSQSNEYYGALAVAQLGDSNLKDKITLR